MNRSAQLVVVALSSASIAAFACSSDVPSTPGLPVASGGMAAASTGGTTPGSGGSSIVPGSGGVSSGGSQPMGSGGASGGVPANTSGGASGGSVANGGSAGASSGGAAMGGQSGASGGAASGGSAMGGATNMAGTSAGGTGGVGGSGKGGSPSHGGQGERCNVAVYDANSPPKSLTLSGSLGVHDPVLIFAHDRYYMFQTGNGVGTKTSTNLTSWQGGGAVFGSNPSWVRTQVPAATNLWAPDISHFGGSYHLYYSASSFGKNRSCIGHATRAALNAGSWTDHGSVVCSNPDGGNSDNWNAIDPNVVLDETGTPWLSFGSFWGGLKMVKLDSTGARADTMLHAIAARPSAAGALEAPFIVRRCGYYYLFASFDKCCEGANSTYKMMVGRSESVTGPYVDKQGTAMMQGGGTLLVQGGTRWKGPGHNAILFTDTKAYNVYHSYDANANGASMLRISELAWDADGWPISAGP